MTRKRRTSKTANIPVYKNPLLQGDAPLPFDGDTQEELLELTEAQEADIFMSTWLDTMRPFYSYRSFFERSELPQAAILKLVKDFYKHFALGEGWSDEKYIMTLDAMLLSQSVLNQEALEDRGKLYEEGELPMQRAQARRKRGRI